jgi:hypothetical protein
MSRGEVLQLRSGDEVYWTDPDSDRCSRTYKIREITVYGDTVRIVDINGSVLECFLSELS